MTAKPGDGMAAAGSGGHLRASRGDREHVVEVLKAAFTQGMLTRDELDMRVGQAFASRSYADLAALTADIPAGLIGDWPLRKPAQPQAAHPHPHPHPQNRVVNSCACATLAVLALGGAFLSGSSGLFYVVVAVIVAALIAVGGRVAYSSHKKR